MKTLIESIKSNAVFGLVNKFGAKCINSNFIVVVCNKVKIFEHNNNYCYLGIRIGKKVGGAVLRNKIKRRLKHVVRNLFNEIKLDDKALIIVPKAKCANLSFDILQNELRLCILKKADF
jgi:ribonuclease P protein component